MKFPRISRKKLLWIGGGLTAVLFLTYLLRWPFFGSTVRGELETIAQNLFGAKVKAEGLSGSIISSVAVHKADLLPGPDSWFREWTIEHLEVSYGLFGSSELDITISGARIVLAPGDGPAQAPHEIAPGVLAELEKFRFPGRLTIRDSTVVLADGRTFLLEEARVENRAWSLKGDSDTFGRIQATSKFDPAGTTTVDATTTKGPVPRAKLILGPPAESRRTLKIETEILENAFTWNGHAVIDDQGRIRTANGELEAKEGSAQTSVNLVDGTAVADLDATFAITEHILGDVRVRGRVSGDLDGDPEEWSFEAIRLESDDFEFRTLRFDHAQVTSPGGTAARIPFKVTARREKDLIEAEGTLRIRPAVSFEADVDVTAEKATPYLALLDPAPPIEAAEVRFEGRVVYDDRGPVVNGTLRSAEGKADRFDWTTVRIVGDYESNRLHIEDLVATGSPFGPLVTAGGSLVFRENGGRAEKFTVECGEDRLNVDGEFTWQGEVDGHVVLMGPGEWLKAFTIDLPESAKPLMISGMATRHEKKSRLIVGLSVGAVVSGGMSATLQLEEDTLKVQVDAGVLNVVDFHMLEYSDFVFEIRPAEIVLSPVRLALDDPDLKATVSGEVDWEETVRLVFAMKDPLIAGRSVDDLSGKISFDEKKKEFGADIMWGKTDGDHLLVKGTLGDQLDLDVSLRVRNLSAQTVRELIGETRIEGLISLDVKVTGTREQPTLSGGLLLKDIKVEEELPITINLPLAWKDNALVISQVVTETRYGPLSIRGRIPAPWAEKPEPIDLHADLTVTHLDAVYDLIPEETRPWVPRGSLGAKASLTGTFEALQYQVIGTLATARFQFPGPIGELTDFHVRAVLEDGVVRIEECKGMLGRGPFYTEDGEFDLDAKTATVGILGDDLLVVDRKMTRLRISPEVTLTWSEEDGASLSGTIDIPLCLWYEEFGVGGGGTGKVKEASAPRIRLKRAAKGGFIFPGIEGLNIALDLDVLTIDEFRIENSVIGALLQVRAYVGGTASEPIVSGSANVTSGEVRLTTGIFITMESADVSLPYEPGKDPTIEFEGRVGKGEEAINVLLVGPLDEPRLELRSNPPQSQEDLLAYLAFGQAPGSVGSKSALGAVATKVLEFVQDDWPKAERDEGFLHDLSVTVKADEADEEKYRAPWELPASGPARGTVVRVEYPLSRYFSVIGESDLEGNVSGDLKLRFRFK